MGSVSVPKPAAPNNHDAGAGSKLRHGLAHDVHDRQAGVGVRGDRRRFEPAGQLQEEFVDGDRFGD
jgi:hypothetical protein